jgi:DNA uptake protein ComE-like DNA-binding protein
MTQESISNKLTELFELHKSGALTKEEYDLLKSQVINAGENKELKEVENFILPSYEKEPVIETSPVTKSNPELLPNSVNETDNQTSDNKTDKTELNSASKKKIYITMMIASTLLILIAAIFIVTRKKNHQDTAQVSELNRSKDNTSVNTTQIAKNKTIAWDEAAATKIIMDELLKYPDWSKISHEIVGFTKISLSKKDLMVTITKSDKNYLSLFEFEDQNGWKLGEKCLAFNSSVDKASLYKIASDKYGLMTIRYEGGAGSSWDHIQLFSFIKGEFKQIFDAPENIKFIPKNEGYYDIETTPKGGQPVLYKFNGSEYVQQ